MNRSKVLSTYIRFAISNRSSVSQVTHKFSPLPHSLSSSSPHHVFTSHLFNSYQKLFFSSTPVSILQILQTHDWSDELERELEKSISDVSMNHETIVYVLKRLDKDPEKANDFFIWVTEKNGFKPSSSMFNLMLRVLCNKECMKLFWITLRKMKEQGFYFDEETYKTVLGIFKKEKMASDASAMTHFYNRMVQENVMDGVVKKMVKVVLDSEWSDEVEKDMEEFKASVSENFVLRGLKELRAHPLKALSFFHWIKKCDGYKHNTVTYNAVARVLGRNDSISEFWTMVEEMKKDGHEMDIDTYVKVSRQFQKWKSLEDAVKLYEFMMDGPYKPSEQDCSVLLRTISVCSAPNLDLVSRVAKKYESVGHSLSKVVYDGIHRSLTSVGKFEEANEIINAMKKAGYEPDNITYSQLVFGLCKAKRHEEACKILDEMEEHGCIPDIKTWTILIQGHCSAKKVDQALMCFAKMMEKNIDADADLLDVLVNGFLGEKKTKGAYELLVQMVTKARLRPWQATYKNMIEKLLNERKLEEAMNLLVLMKKQNYPPFPQPFDQYISKFGSVNDAFEYLKVLSIKEFPSVSAFVNVFQSFFNEGRHSEAKDLLYKCPHHIRKHEEISKLFGSANSDKAAV